MSPSRRRFISASAAAAAAAALGPRLLSTANAAETAVVPRRREARYPIGLELYAVRKELARDLPGTLKAVAEMGYEVVEFYAPYMSWTMPFAKGVRAQLDDLGLRCWSTHNPMSSLLPGEAMTKAVELNQILGARHIIAASPPSSIAGVEGWKQVSAQFSAASEALRPHGLLAGFHNHRVEWNAVGGGQRAMDVIAANTPADFVLQLDVGTCLEAGVDPVSWIRANPGRIRSIHLKDWAPGTAADEKGYRVLFGEGTGRWSDIVAAAESVGGVEFYLMEQEGSRYSELETARRGLDGWRALRKAG